MRCVKAGLLVLGLLSGALAATQWVAHTLAFHPALGRPWLRAGAHRLYSPLRYPAWSIRFHRSAPGVFRTGNLIMAAGVVLGALGAVVIRLHEARAADRPTTFGSSRWATHKEVKRYGLLRHEGLMLGALDGRYLRHSGPEHVLVFAPTRSGKGAGLVLPTLLTTTESVIVHDIKDENYLATAGWRQQFSRVVYFNPTDPQSDRYNPLLDIRKGPHEVKDTQNIADVLVDPEGAKDRRDHWEKTAHSLLVGAIVHVMYAERDKTLRGVANFLSDPERSFDETLDAMMATSHLEGRVHPVVAGTARELKNKSPNELSGVLSTAMSFLGLYRDPVVARATSASDFMIADIRGGERPMSLYLGQPPSDISRVKSLMRLTLNQIGRRLTESLTPPKHRLVLMLDEFAALGRLDFFATSLGYFAGYGIRAFLIVPSLNQIDNLYGRDNAIFDHCHVRVAFAANDDRTAQRISDLLGTATELRASRTLSGGRFAFMLDRATVSHMETPRPLLTPGEILQLPEDDEIILLGGRLPVRAKKIRYFQDKTFLERVCDPPRLPQSAMAGAGSPAPWM